MDRLSFKASKFIAVAHYFRHADSAGNPSESYSKAFAFEPSATIEDIFAAIWPTGEHSYKFHLAPARIEILPDENSIPPEPHSAFNDMLEGT